MRKPALIQVIHRELLRIASSKVLVFSTLIGPILVFILVQQLFSAGVIRNAPIAVVDSDQTATSRKVTRLVEATPIAHIAYQCSNLQDAKALMDKGKIDAILELPENMERDILKSQHSNLALYINNANIVLGGNLKSGLYKTLASVSAGIKMQVYMKKGATEYQAMQKIMPIRLKTHMLFNPFGSYSYFLAIGLLPLLLTVFTFLGSLYALGMELREGTAHAFMKSANQQTLIAVIGKMVPYTFLFFVNAMCMNLILFKVQGTPLNGSFGMILLSELVMIVSYQAIAVLLIGLTANMRLSLSLGSAYTMMALTFSGLTFPSMAMPLAAKIFGTIFPFTSWLKVFLAQSLRGEPVHDSMQPMVVLQIFIILGLISLPLLKEKLTTPEKWGKA